MAPFELLLLSALVAGSAARPFQAYNNMPSVQLTQALDWYQSRLNAGSKNPASGYQCFHGDVSNYPSYDQWLSFDDLWSINQPQILSSNGGDTYIEHYIKEAIIQVSRESKVDSRFILAAVMQESSGKASVPCTGSIPNCGILQASYDSQSFDPSDAQSSILTMLREGVEGTTSGGQTGQGGPGYAQFLNGDLSWVQNAYPGNPYAAARAYNSGAVGSNLDVVESGTASYSNDIANRLLGWDGTGNGFAGCSS